MRQPVQKDCPIGNRTQLPEDRVLLFSVQPAIAAPPPNIADVTTARRPRPVDRKLQKMCGCLVDRDRFRTEADEPPLPLEAEIVPSHRGTEQQLHELQELCVLDISVFLLDL